MDFRRRKLAFSLTELLVVISIIFILMALLVVGIEQIYGRAIMTKCQHRLEQIGHAIQMYSSQSHGLLPRSWDVYTGNLWYQTLGNTYLDNWNVLACPSVGEPPELAVGGSWTSENRENVETLLSSLRWLKSKQITTGTYKGRWSYKTATSTTGYYQGVTGLALLSFFGFGCNDKHPPEFAETVRMAVQYLSSDVAQYKTGADAGRFKNNTDKEFYAQGICTMALCAASRVLVDNTFRQQARDAAQLAINYILANQGEHGVFCYDGNCDPFPDPLPPCACQRGADTSIIGWNYQALAAALVAGLGVPQTALDRANVYLAQAADGSGRSTYRYFPPCTSGGWMPLQHTPNSLNSRLMLGQGPTHPKSVLSANYLINNGIVNNHMNSADFYRKYYVTLAMYRMGGDYWNKWYKGDATTPGWTGYPDQVNKYVQQEGEDKLYWLGNCAGGDAQSGGGSDVGDAYATALACLILEGSFEEHWIDESWTPAGGKCSYGYNNRLGKTRRLPAGDTIIVMDYENWEIDHDDLDVAANDTVNDIAARHLGLANCLLGDGHVEAYAPEDIKDGRWTLEAGD